MSVSFFSQILGFYGVESCFISEKKYVLISRRLSCAENSSGESCWRSKDSSNCLMSISLRFCGYASPIRDV